MVRSALVVSTGGRARQLSREGVATRSTPVRIIAMVGGGGVGQGVACQKKCRGTYMVPAGAAGGREQTACRSHYCCA